MTGADLRLAADRFKAEHDLRELLGLEGDRPESRTKGGEWGVPCPLCGGRDRLRVWPEDPRGAGVWCRRCEFRADPLDLALVQAGGDPSRPGSRADFLRERGYLEENPDPRSLERRRAEAARREAERSEQRAAAEANEAAEVAELAFLCRRAWGQAPGLEHAGQEWARSRGLAPGALAGLARAAAGAGLQAERLSPLRRCHVVLPLWNLSGGLAALQGRGGVAKSLGTRGKRGVVVFANPLAVELLRGERKQDGPVVISEGGTDWLAWASRRADLAVFGVVSGSAAPLGARLAELGVGAGAPVVIRTDPDDAGDGYAEALGAELQGADLLRPVPRFSSSGDRDRRDDGSLLRAGELPEDPTADCESWPPRSPEPERSRGGSRALPVVFPEGLAPDLEEGEVEARLSRFVSAALAGSLESSAGLALAPPPGAGKTRTTAGVMLESLAQAKPRKRRRPILFACQRHEQINALMTDALPAAARELGGEADLERDTRKRPYRLEVEIRGRKIVGVRLPEFDCDPRLSKDEAKERKRRRNALSQSGDNPRQACEGCRYFKRKGSAYPKGGWCSYWREAQEARDAAKPTGDADFVLLTSRRLVTKPPKASLVIQDEDLTGELADGEVLDRDDLEAYAIRLAALRGRAETEAVRATRSVMSGRGNEGAPAREDLALDRLAGIEAMQAAASAVAACFGRFVGWRVELPPPPGVSAAEGAAVVKWAWRKGSRLDRSERKGRNLANELGEILCAWAAGRSAVLLCEQRDKKGRCLALTVPIRRQVPAVPLIYLDATLVQEVAEPLLGRSLGVIRGLTPSRRADWAELKPLQLTDQTNSKTRLTDAQLGQSQAHKAARVGVRALERLAPGARVLGVIGPKDLANTSSGPKESRGTMTHVHRQAYRDRGGHVPEVRAELYHGAITGSNSLKGADAVHVVGMPAVPETSLRLLALHLRPGITEEELEERPRSRQAEIGSHRGRFWCYLPDSPMGLAWRAKVLAQVQQAGGRAHRGGACARALLFSCAVPFPYPLPVKRGTSGELFLDDEGDELLAKTVGAEGTSQRELARVLGVGRPRARRLAELASSLPEEVRRSPIWAAHVTSARRSTGPMLQGPVHATWAVLAGPNSLSNKGITTPEGGIAPLYVQEGSHPASWADLLRVLEEQRGRAEVASALGRDRTTLWRWSRGEVLPGTEARERIRELAEELFAELRAAGAGGEAEDPAELVEEIAELEEALELEEGDPLALVAWTAKRSRDRVPWLWNRAVFLAFALASIPPPDRPGFSSWREGLFGPPPPGSDPPQRGDPLELVDQATDPRPLVLLARTLAA